MIDPPERRRSEGRFGGLWQFRGFRGAGTRDWAARVSLRGERSYASEPVAREGSMCAGPEGVRRPETGSGGAEEPGRSVRDFFVTGEAAGEVSSTFLNYRNFEEIW